MRRMLIAATAALALGACAPAAERAADSFPSNSNTRVRVQNNNWLDMTIYLVRGTHRTRLGTVTAMQRAEFKIPDSYMVGVSDMMLQADPIGARETYLTQPMQVFRGAQLEFTVANVLRHSNSAVYGAPKY